MTCRRQICKFWFLNVRRMSVEDVSKQSLNVHGRTPNWRDTSCSVRTSRNIVRAQTEFMLRVSLNGKNGDYLQRATSRKNLWTSSFGRPRHGNRKTSSLWRKSANTASDRPSEHLSAEEVIGFKYNSFRADPCLWECSFGGFLVFYRNTFVCVCLSLGSPERSSGVVACDITEELCQRTRKIWSRSDEDVSFSLEKLDSLLTQWTYVWTRIKCSYSGHDVPREAKKLRNVAG